MGRGKGRTKSLPGKGGRRFVVEGRGAGGGRGVSAATPLVHLLQVAAPVAPEVNAGVYKREPAHRRL